MSKSPKYKRVLLKISGQCMCPPGESGIDASSVDALISEIDPVVKMGVESAVVIGGGNFIRSRDLSENSPILRVTADYMGMLGTVMNALALRDSLEGRGIQARVLTAIPMPSVCESFSARQTDDHLRSGRVAILAAGTGSPFFTTDMCAALRANEIDADVLLKATKVDGVFDEDPGVNPNARKYETLTYQKVLADQLGVMDLTAISLCMENRIPIIVFQLSLPGNLLKAVTGQKVGTIVTD